MLKGKQNLLKTEQVRVKSFDKYGICSLISVYKQIADLIKDCALNADLLTSILFVYIPAKDQAYMKNRAYLHKTDIRIFKHNFAAAEAGFFWSTCVFQKNLTKYTVKSAKKTCAGLYIKTLHIRGNLKSQKFHDF